jgi:hypothetical protein
MNDRETFARLGAAVRAVALLEGYVDAGREEIDKKVAEAREAFVAFCTLPSVIDLFGAEPVAEALNAIDEDARRCGNCGTLDCENEECDED